MTEHPSATETTPTPFHVLAGDLRPGVDVLIADGTPSLVVEMDFPDAWNAYALRITLEDGRTVDTYTDRTTAIV